MSRFNKANTLPKDYSANGNLQFVKSPEQELYELMVTFLVGKDGYYASSDEKTVRLNHLVNQVVSAGKVDFVANLLVYARKEMHIRNAPILGYVELIKALRATKQYPNWVRKLTTDVIGRADQITDILALTLEAMGGKSNLPMAMKRGLADAMNGLNQHTLAKYNRKGAVTFKDVLRIVHPKPKDAKTAELFSKVLKDTLGSAQTWEVALSTNGAAAAEDKKSKKEVWENMISSGKMGYQATLKNLRNMLEANVSPEHMQTVCAYLVRNVQRSKALPFEFLAAYEAVEPLCYVLVQQTLVQCMEASVANMPSFGNTVVYLDTSGSMTMCTAGKQAAFLAAVLAKACQSSDRFALVKFHTTASKVSVDTSGSVFSIYRELASEMRGGSTNFRAALEVPLPFRPDSVFVLTDGEINRFSEGQCSRTYGPRYAHYDITSEILNHAKGRNLSVAVNMEARPTTPLAPQAGWHVLAGWSPKIFEYCEALSKGDSIVKMLSKPYATA